MTTAYQIGYLLGAFVAITVSIAIIVFICKRLIGKNCYDERQEMLRGRGYKYSFFTLLIGSFVIMITSSDVTFVSVHTQLAFVIFASIGVYAVYCIVKDAYFGLRDKRKRFFVLSLIIMAANSLVFIHSCAEGIDWSAAVPDGVLNLFCAILFATISIVAICKNLVDKRKAD